MKVFKITVLIGESKVDVLEVVSSNDKSASKFAVKYFQRETNSLIRVKKCEEIK